MVEGDRALMPGPLLFLREEWREQSWLRYCYILIYGQIGVMIAIIDYGMGNLRSVSKAFEAVGHQAVVTRDPRVIGNASHVVLPGVGAFGDCMANVERYGLAEPIRAAIQSGKPFLGICLGLQLLFTESEEFGAHKGLGIIPGRVRRFEIDPTLKVPHMGWNQVNVQRPCPLFEGIADGDTLVFCAFVFRRSGRPADRCDDDHIRRSVCVEYLAEQCGGLSVPSRKESGHRVATHQEFWVVAYIDVSG